MTMAFQLAVVMLGCFGLGFAAASLIAAFLNSRDIVRLERRLRAGNYAAGGRSQADGY
jgi:hypothetical protein